MRKSIDRLCELLKRINSLWIRQKYPVTFLRRKKRCDRIKALLWESDGFVLLYKHVEVQGRFHWPRNQPGGSKNNS